jgi:hypothetical protein
MQLRHAANLCIVIDAVATHAPLEVTKHYRRCMILALQDAVRALGLELVERHPQPDAESFPNGVVNR